MTKIKRCFEDSKATSQEEFLTKRLNHILKSCQHFSFLISLPICFTPWFMWWIMSILGLPSLSVIVQIYLETVWHSVNSSSKFLGRLLARNIWIYDVDPYYIMYHQRNRSVSYKCACQETSRSGELILSLEKGEWTWLGKNPTGII